ncbi:hypothetical protein [Psychromonas sp. Urea-02u-13]|uniref:hypothetical protein n=1 Tax=Psychromonas sp. Urea-02u-13 TaxID=2058326 RepID=UPI000C33C26C|nr:hypothetical protein [Psychromonas sp. Urea-02u-13]PKG37875.1 hypothetical protein CXF74_16445 [Psychromonas sp. Urea-02u-13]
MKYLNGYYVVMFFLFFNSKLYAGRDVNITFANNTNEPLVVERGHNECWYYEDLKKKHTIPPNSYKEIYTQIKSSGSCFFTGNKYLNLRLINSTMNSKVVVMDGGGMDKSLNKKVCASSFLGYESPSKGSKSKVKPVCTYTFEVNPKMPQ